MDSSISSDLSDGAVVSLAALAPDRDAMVCGAPRPSLMELGFTPGARVRVIAKAWFRGPLAVRVGSDTFALRRDEAKGLIVKPIPL